MRKLFSKRVRSMLTLAAVATMGGVVESSKAALVLTLTEPGYAPAQYTDNFNSTVGTVFTGLPVGYGTFTVDIEIGTSNENYGGGTPPSDAKLEIQSLQVVANNGAGKTLTISLTQNGFTFPGSPGSTEFMDSALAGTLSPTVPGDLVTFQSYATVISGNPATNVSSGLQTYTSTAASGNTQISVPDKNTTFISPLPFDLTNVTTITLANPGEEANLAGTTTVTAPAGGVPEPTSIALIGFGSAVATLCRRPRRTA